MPNVVLYHLLSQAFSECLTDYRKRIPMYQLTADTAKSNDVKSIETSVELPQNMTDDFQTEIYYIDSQEESDKCYEALQHRDGKIIIEVVTGTVTGENGDGQIDYQGYIKYHGDLAIGTRIESVMIYNPNNNYIDDIMYRADTIIE